MRRNRLLLGLFAVSLIAPPPSLLPQSAIPSSSSTLTAASPSSSAPPAPTVAMVKVVTDEYYGTKVSDPYRYMENLKDSQVQSWFKAQNNYTRAVLERIPGRTNLLARIKELDESEPAFIVAVRVLPNYRIFYSKRLASEEVAKLYMREGWNGDENLLLDPKKYEKAGGQHYSINYFVPSTCR